MSNTLTRKSPIGKASMYPIPSFAREGTVVLSRHVGFTGSNFLIVAGIGFFARDLVLIGSHIFGYDTASGAPNMMGRDFVQVPQGAEYFAVAGPDIGITTQQFLLYRVVWRLWL